MARSIQPLVISREQRQQLRSIVNRPKAAMRDVRRAWIILNRADGLSQQQTAERNRVNRPVVAKWEKRFRQQGLAGLADAPRRGRPERLSADLKGRIVTQATQPPPGRQRWSVRTMARTMGVSKATVQRLWSANEIKPHLTRVFKLSRDPQFEQKFWDVIGLYLNPPDKALVLCCDEKSQCQALQRTQPGLPLGVGHIRTQTHDYYRHGTVTLFAALSYLDGKIFRQTAPRHRHQEWLSFLKRLHRQTPPDLTLHLILDNYATHKHPKVQAWLKAKNRQLLQSQGRNRFVLHFTPTSSSWMNLVERFFRDVTQEAIRDGSFSSVRELTVAIEQYLAERDLNPKRYVWKASGEAILAKIQKARAAQSKLNDTA
jgi:transcriptional regulator with XRE-family HTH domain